MVHLSPHIITTRDDICLNYFQSFFYFFFQQFVNGSFESSYYPTAKKETHYPSVIHHDHKYNLKIVDIPDIPFFPVSSFYNISDLKGMYHQKYLS